MSWVHMHVLGPSSWTIHCILDDEIETDLHDSPVQTDIKHQNLDLNSPFLRLFIYSFIYFWEREKTWAGEGQKGRERGNLKQAPRWQHRARRGPWSHNHEIMTCAKIESWMLNWRSHPGAPKLTSSYSKSCVLLYHCYTQNCESSWGKRHLER